MERESVSRGPRTPLRASYDRVKALDADAQLRECVDLLQNPDILANDLAEAYVLADSCCEAPAPADGVQASEGDDEISLERFVEGVGIQITGGEPAELRCLSGEFDPLGGPGDTHGQGLDYIAMQHQPESAPVLGAVASMDEKTPYAVLMRLLACFTEMAAPALVEHWDKELFKGALGTDPRFHLHLVLWRPGELTLAGSGPAHFSLYELTRDLAALAREACLESPPLGSYLASITCLRVDPEEADGPLEFEWRI